MLHLFLGGEQVVQYDTFEHTQPTINSTIQQRYPDDPMLTPPEAWGSHLVIPRAMSKEQHNRYMDLMKLVMFVFDAHNITYRYEELLQEHPPPPTLT